MTCPDCVDKHAIAERAAVLEYDAHMSREAAEIAARREFRDKCWGCGRPCGSWNHC